MNPFSFFQGYLPQPNNYFIENQEGQQQSPFGSYPFARQVDEFGFDLYAPQNEAQQQLQQAEISHEAFHPHIRQHHFEYDAGNFNPVPYLNQQQQYYNPQQFAGYQTQDQYRDFQDQYQQQAQWNYTEQQGYGAEKLQDEQHDPDRQPNLERRVSALERKEEQNSREIERLNRENNQQQRAIERLTNQNQQQNQEIERLNRRLNRVNQRLRAVENRLNIPFTPFEGGY
ncbi:hypothetical protein SAMN04488577_3062 [Bacillus sp. cl95]|nr:hypothetical protein SAMN02799634_10558 [Bacillus sp. UNCCL13]SFQ87521.1 hypothetical protein SAMN04488577_3062 [Bacillus sp. cl95]